MVLFLLKKNPYKSSEQGVCHNVALSFRFKSIVRQKKDYKNSNISPCKNIISSKNLLKETKILQNIITLQLISSFNTSQNMIFQKYSYKNRPGLLPRGQNPLSYNTLFNESKHNILALVGKANKLVTKVVSFLL